jgi:PII-like signaling protein
MSLPTEGKLLRIFIGEADHWKGKPRTGDRARGANARAPAPRWSRASWASAHSRIHTAKLLGFSDLPIIIEIVDAPEKIEAFMPDLEAMVGDGLITLEHAEVLALSTRPIVNLAPSASPFP